MYESAAVIDLGDLGGMPDDRLPLPSPAARRRWWRSGAVVLVALLCLGLTAAGATMPTRLLGGFEVGEQGSDYQVGASALYLPSGEHEVTALDLHDGHVLWRATLPHEVSSVQLVGDGEPMAVEEQGYCSTLTMLDPKTGHPLWSHVGTLVGDTAVGPGLWILHGTTTCAEDDGGFPPDGGSPAGVIDVVEWDSGAVLASLPVPANSVPVPSVDGATMALWDVRGHVVERDAATGAVVASGELPALVDPGDQWLDKPPSVVILEHAWVVLDPPSMTLGHTDVIITAYGRPALDPLWTVKVPGSMADVREFYILSACAPTVLCAQLGEAEQVRLDATTGARLPDGRTDAQRIGAHWSITAQKALVVGGEELVIHDDRTGRNAYPSWRVQTITREDPAVVVLRRTIRDRTEFAIFDGHAGRLRVLGETAVDIDGCEAAGHALLCVDKQRVLHVWPVTY